MVDLEEEGDRGIVDSEVQDENFAPIRLQEGDFAKRKPLRIWLKKELGGGGVRRSQNVTILQFLFFDRHFLGKFLPPFEVSSDRLNGGSDEL
jgi:hypothetical protein